MISLRPLFSRAMLFFFSPLTPRFDALSPCFSFRHAADFHYFSDTMLLSLTPPLTSDCR